MHEVYRPLFRWLCAFVGLTLLIVVGGVIGNYWNPAKHVAGGTFFLLLILVPAVLVLKGRETLEEIHYHQLKGWIPTVLRMLLAGPIGCFGLCAILIGLAMPTWIVWNVFDPQPEFRGNAWAAIFQSGAFLLMLPFGWYLIKLSIGRGGGMTRSEIEAEEALYREQIKNPDFESLEAALGCELPGSYRAFFSGDPSIATLAIDRLIEYNAPATDSESMEIEGGFLKPGVDAICNAEGFPDSNGGHLLMLGDPAVFFDARSEPHPVYAISFDEPQERTQVADSLQQFIAGLRPVD